MIDMTDKIAAINTILHPYGFTVKDWEAVKAIASAAYDAGVASVQPDEPLALWEFELLEGETSLPDTLTTEADVNLAWPEGTLVVDRDGDTYEYHTDHWTLVQWHENKGRNNAKYDHDSNRTLELYLPAQVVVVAEDSTPKVGDTVRIREGAVGDNTFDHSLCEGLEGVLGEYGGELYLAVGHIGPLSDFEKIS